MSTGSMRSPASSPGGRVVSVMYSSGRYDYELNIKEANVFGVSRDEAPARLDVLAHQDREQLVGGSGVVERHLTQHPDGRIHRGLPQLLGVHLAETLVALDAVLRVDLLARGAAGLEQAVPLAVRVGELGIR